MSWSVIWHPRTAKALTDLARQDPSTARRIRQRVAAFALSGQGDIRKLEGHTNAWRLRVGDWRVVFTFDPPGSITVLEVSNRRDAYR